MLGKKSIQTNVKDQTPKFVTFFFPKMCIKIVLLRDYCKNRSCSQKQTYKLFVYSSDLSLQWAVTANKEYLGRCWTKIRKKKKKEKKSEKSFMTVDHRKPVWLRRAGSSRSICPSPCSSMDTQSRVTGQCPGGLWRPSSRRLHRLSGQTVQQT